MSDLRIDNVVTSGTFSLDGGTWDVDNNVWLVGDDSEVLVIDAGEDPTAGTLGDVLALRARHRAQVLDEWRMRPGGGRGRGVTALFAGDSGTGKTMSAEVIAADLGLGISIEPVGHFDPVTFDPGLVEKVRGAADRLGLSHRDIVSGAGHDACWINKVAPTVMIMCPCVDGLSHNEAEEITPEWAAAGADVLLNAVLEVAGSAD